jgi:hypothetical protein
LIPPAHLASGARFRYERRTELFADGAGEYSMTSAGAVTMMRFTTTFAVLLAAGCTAANVAQEPDDEPARQQILAVNDSIVAAMTARTPTTAYLTGEWSGVNLNGTPMSAEGFEGEGRTMQYDSIHVRDRDVRVYGETAALRWHADFFVKVNGNPSYAEMRLLDLYVLRDGRWLNDLTQVTPVYGTVGNPPAP